MTRRPKTLRFIQRPLSMINFSRMALSFTRFSVLRCGCATSLNGRAFIRTYSALYAKNVLNGRCRDNENGAAKVIVALAAPAGDAFFSRTLLVAVNTSTLIYGNARVLTSQVSQPAEISEFKFVPRFFAPNRSVGKLCG